MRASSCKKICGFESREGTEVWTEIKVMNYFETDNYDLSFDLNGFLMALCMIVLNEVPSTRSCPHPVDGSQ